MQPAGEGMVASPGLKTEEDIRHHRMQLGLCFECLNKATRG